MADKLELLTVPRATQLTNRHITRFKCDWYSEAEYVDSLQAQFDQHKFDLDQRTTLLSKTHAFWCECCKTFWHVSKDWDPDSQRYQICGRWRSLDLGGSRVMQLYLRKPVVTATGCVLLLRN